MCYRISVHLIEHLVAEVPPIPVAISESVPSARTAPAWLRVIGYLKVVVTVQVHFVCTEAGTYPLSITIAAFPLMVHAVLYSTAEYVAFTSV